ncbi:hypothetical protein B0H16DRAFT_1478291 [Mycena metata]|uniref:Uncharacterized protein n=1 Tax=Mycena metata TaxID=1033252 RepID=A0AAD7MEL3_9AGAR|nr:hypothetical protein B0H16DRAFT_1478291 [Mycena metata]
MTGNKRAAATSANALRVAKLAAAEALEDSQVAAKKPRGRPKKKKKSLSPPRRLLCPPDQGQSKHNGDEGRQGLSLGVQTKLMKGLPWRPNEIRLESPWFFEIRKLIASRPNLQPVGVGNNETVVDTSILLPTTDDDASSTFDTQLDIYHDISDTEEDPPHPPAPTSDDDEDPPQLPAPTSDDDELPPVPTLESAPVKRKRVQLAGADTKGPDTKAAPARKKTKPQVSTSAPAPGKPAPATSATPTPVASKKKGTKGKEGFTATLKQEKYKGQKEQLARINAEAEVRLAREKRKGEAKKVDKEAKIALQHLKMEQEHQYRLAQLHAQAGPSEASSSCHDSAFGLFYQSTTDLNDGLGHLSISQVRSNSGGQSRRFGGALETLREAL